MAQLIHSRVICDGRFLVQTIAGVGRRKPRVIEIEMLDTGGRLHGSAQWLAKVVQELETRMRTSSARVPNSAAHLFACKAKRP